MRARSWTGTRDGVSVVEPLGPHGLRTRHVQALALGSVWLSLALWIRAKTVDQSFRDNAERRAIFVGLWAPTLWLIAESLDR